MKKILVPIDGTERSLDSLQLVKELYKPEDAELFLLMVMENFDEVLTQERLEKARHECQALLDRETKNMPKYNAITHIGFGNAGSEIVNYAKECNADFIVMTRSTKKGLARILGSVTAYVVKNADCVVMVVPEGK